MRICVNCGNEYPKERRSCPWCGYPADRNDYPQEEYTMRLRSRFDVIRVRKNSLTLWDASQQRKLLCRIIPEGDAGTSVIRYLEKIQTLPDVGPFPAILEIYRAGKGEGYYLTEHVSGVTLMEVVQKQNPPEVTYVDQITRELYILISRILICPVRHGSLSLDNLVIRQNGSIVPIDYGECSPIDPDDDVIQIFRIILRLYSGQWQYLTSTEGVESRIRELRERAITMQPPGSNEMGRQKE